jgi:hypothetical protein
LETKDIEELASRTGVSRRDVENFLDTVGQAGTEEGDLLSLYYDARLYAWDISTILAIEAGIRLAYSDRVPVEKVQAIDKRIESPLPAAHYSLWPRRIPQAKDDASKPTLLDCIKTGET